MKQRVMVGFVAMFLGILLTEAQGIQNVKVTPDVIYGYKDGMALTMDVFIPEKSNGAGVVFINSGGFISPNFSRQCQDSTGNLWPVGNNYWEIVPKNKIKPELLQQVSFVELLNTGFTVFDVRHGSSPKYRLDEIINDCQKAITFIKKYAYQYQISNKRIGIWGGSAGGFLAGYLATNPLKGNELKAAVLYYPAGYDFLEPYNDKIRKQLPALHLSESMLDSLSLKNYINEATPPTLVLYGENDDAYATATSKAIIRDLQKYQVPNEEKVFKNAGHVWLNKDWKQGGQYIPEIGDEAMESLIDWFSKYL